jgi:hypothetical protein
MKGGGMRETQIKIYNELVEAGEFVTFEEAHVLKGSIGNMGFLTEQRPGAVSRMAEHVSGTIRKQMSKAGERIPGDVREQMVHVGQRSGAESLEQVGQGPTVKMLYDRATNLAREGFEVYNESMIGPALKLATEEQFQSAVVAGVRAPAMMRAVKETLFDSRYAGVIKEMGQKEGVQNLSGQRLWDGVRGQWLAEQLLQSMPDARTGIIDGVSFYNRITKPRVNRAMLTELFDTKEIGNIRDLGHALAAVQDIPTGAVGKTVVTLMQFGALTAGFSSEIREQTGGWTTPVAFILAPLALGRMTRNPSVVRALNQGISGKMPAASLSRWMTQMLREFYAHDIPFTAVQADGTKHRVNPEARKRGTAPAPAFAPERGKPFGRTAIPTP